MYFSLKNIILVRSEVILSDLYLVSLIFSLLSDQSTFNCLNDYVCVYRLFLFYRELVELSF